MAVIAPVPARPPSLLRAQELVVLLGLCWGPNWVAVKIALEELRPWSLRLPGMGLGWVLLLRPAPRAAQAGPGSPQSDAAPPPTLPETPHDRRPR
jgi:hypothetical protein